MGLKAVSTPIIVGNTGYTWSVGQNFNSGDLILNGASSGTITLNAAGTAGTNTLTLPAATDTLAVIGTAQTWTAAQSFNSGFVKLNGSSSGTTTLNAAAAAGTTTITLPAATDTVAVLGTAQTWTAAQTHNSGFLKLAGSSSGTTTLNAAAAAGTTTITLPAVTDTLAVLGTAQTWTAAQSFNSGFVKLNGSSSGAITLNAAAAAGTSTLVLPGVSDTLAVIGTAQTWTAAQSFNSGFVKLNGSSSGTTTLNAAAAAGSTTITLPAVTGTVLIQGGTGQSSVAAPSGTTSTTGVMMGLNGAITPNNSGRILVIVSGDISNSTSTDGAKVQIRTGTGTAPTNAAALTGTTGGGLVQFTLSGTAQKVPFSLNAVVTGLTVATAVWIDVGLAAITAGTASIADVSISAIEI